MRIKVSENKELVNEIRQRLQENKEKYGQCYCPCVNPALYEADEHLDYICMCKQFREQGTGECHCGLYVKLEE